VFDCFVFSCESVIEMSCSRTLRCRADPQKKNIEKNREKKNNRAPGKLLRDEVTYALKCVKML
jgi:hypothetical protein